MLVIKPASSYDYRMEREAPSGVQSFKVFGDEIDIGYCDIEWQAYTRRACGHYSLFKDFWGKGYGNQMQDAIEKVIEGRDYTVEVSPLLSDRAYRFWLKRDPDRVRGYVPSHYGAMSWSNDEVADRLRRIPYSHWHETGYAAEIRRELTCA